MSEIAIRNVMGMFTYQTLLLKEEKSQGLTVGLFWGFRGSVHNVVLYAGYIIIIFFNVSG